MSLQIIVNIAKQKLYLYDNDKLLHSYLVSTAKNGIGEQINSECTPLGKHVIADKIGAEAEVNTVFVGRQATGEIYHHNLKEQYPQQDWILTRILRLSGLEEAKNKGGMVDSYQRFIYIHGTPDDTIMGVAGSRGCIRMRNNDITSLFDQVEVATPVTIIKS